MKNLINALILAASASQLGDFKIETLDSGSTIFSDEWGVEFELILNGDYVAEIVGCGRVTNLFLVSSMEKRGLTYTGSQFIIK